MDNTIPASDMFKVDDPFSFLTKDLLTQEYVVDGLTDQQIATKHGIGSKATIWRRRKFFGIVNSHPRKSNTNASKNRTVNISRQDAEKWKEKGLTYWEIAERLGCSRISVCRRYKDLGLVESETHAMHKLKWHETVTPIQETFLLGTLLGDGSITPGGMFQCNHSAKQFVYVQYKTQLLTSLISPHFRLRPHHADDGTGKSHECYYLRTMQNRFLKDMRQVFYDGKTKIFPNEFLKGSKFDNFSLAVWYMDDGGISQLSAQLSTYSFGFRGNLSILDFLHTKFKLKGTLYDSKGENRSPDMTHYVHFSVEESKKFFSLVAPHIIPSMQYKLPPEFRGQYKEQPPKK